jgi:uncharacterized small protein (DUF1192 family)
MLLVVGLLGFGSGPMWADTITLKDGSVIKGKISYTGPYTIKFDVDIPLSSAVREIIQKNSRIDFYDFGFSGSLSIPRSEISKMEVSGVDEGKDSKTSTPTGSIVSVEALIEKIEALRAELEELKAQVRVFQARIEKLEGKETMETQGTQLGAPRSIPISPEVYEELKRAAGVTSPAQPTLQDMIDEVHARTTAPTTPATAKGSYYIGNFNSRKFHRPDCKWAKKISPANRLVFKSRQDVINQGYQACKVCKP